MLFVIGFDNVRSWRRFECGNEDLETIMRPVHKIKPNRSIIAYTWCGVEPYRRGDPDGGRPQQSRGDLQGLPGRGSQGGEDRQGPAPDQGDQDDQSAAPVQSATHQHPGRLIETSGSKPSSSTSGLLYRRIDGFGPAVETIYEILVDTTRKVREIMDAKKVTDWRLENEPT